jgi:hypothetical protein
LEFRQVRFLPRVQTNPCWRAKSGTNTMRNLCEIAQEIKTEWKNPYFGAVPYLKAMSFMNSINDNFYGDSGKSIVAYFLANAGTWRGDTAKRVKAELKSML